MLFLYRPTVYKKSSYIEFDITIGTYIGKITLFYVKTKPILLSFEKKTVIHFFVLNFFLLSGKLGEAMLPFNFIHGTRLFKIQVCKDFCFYETCVLTYSVALKLLKNLGRLFLHSRRICPP